MSNVASQIAAGMTFEMPEMKSLTVAFEDDGRPSVADGPVLTVAEGCLGTLRVELHVDEGDDLQGMSASVYRTITRLAPQMVETEITFSRSDAILDDSDFIVGERLMFRARARHDA
jgi:hypothetical protein